MLKLFLFAGFILLFGIGFSQPPDVIVDGKGKREIEPSSRILEFPRIIDTVKAAAVTAYPLLIFQQATKIILDTIPQATVETTEKIKLLYPFYSKIAFGSKLMPLGELYYNSTRSRIYHYGAHIKHISSFSNIKRGDISFPNGHFDRTEISLFGKINQSSFNLGARFHYLNDGLHFYGLPDSTVSAAKTIEQRYQNLGADFEFIGNRGDTSILNYKITTGFNFLSTQKPIIDSLSDWRAKENQFYINSKGWYNYKSETFYVNLGLRRNAYRYGIADSTLNLSDSGLVTNNTIIDFQPGILTQLFQNKFKVEVGLALSVDIQKKTKVYVYPQVEIKYSLFNDIFIPFIGIRGGLKQNSLRNFSSENPYLISNLTIQNEHNPHEIYAGFKGTLSSKLSFNINGSSARILNKALYISDTLFSSFNKFNVIYDTINITKLEASGSYQENEKFKIDLIGRFFSYQAKNEAFAWNLPQFQFLLRGSYNLYDKFLVNLSAKVETGRQAKGYGPGESIVEENGQYAKSLGAIVDINLGIEYRYNTRVSSFLQINNLASQQYYRWYNYPVQPIQVMAGVTARF
jgi:hypothetical protein